MHVRTNIIIFQRNENAVRVMNLKKLENFMINSKKANGLGLASLRQTNTEYNDSLAKFCHLIVYDSRKIKITSLITDLPFKWLENSEN